MIQCQIKLRLNGKQKRKQLEWLPILGSIFNFGIRKIELNNVICNCFYFFCCRFFGRNQFIWW